MIGKVLDEKYEILELIGQGGMARVYKAKDIRLDRYVAVKVLKNEFMDNEQFLKKFLREAQADAKLAHPNIVNVYDVGIQDGIYYIVMEYIDGSTLKNYIRTNKRISPEETVELLLSIASGLNHAHANNIIHRDIKPHNILLTTGKIPKVADFGIARAITSSTVTATEEALGSVHYISPEQARGGFLDERSDLYSLGIMMYEMLIGELPYDGDTPVAVALKHVQNDVPSPRDKVRSIPQNVAQIVLNLTRRKPDDRYQNAAALIEDLKRVSADSQTPVKPTYETAEYPSKGKDIRNRGGDEKTSKNGKGKTEPKKKFWQDRRKMTYLGAGVVAVLIIAAVLLSTLLGTKVPVSKVEGMTVEEATEELAKNDLKCEVVERVYNKDVEAGRVISQYPEAGTEVRKNHLIELTVSNGPAVSEIPDVRGYSEAVAKSKLEAKGFPVKETIYMNNDTYRNGTVYDQNPAGGVEAREGTEVTLYVSKGKDSITMPKLTGLSLENAKTEITNNELILGEVTYEASSDFPKGQVIRQTPTAFSEVMKNSRVDLVISLGPVSTKNITIDLSPYTTDVQGDRVDVKVEMYDVGGGHGSTVYAQKNRKDDVITVTFQGVGNKIYKLFINGVEKYSGVVSF